MKSIYAENFKIALSVMLIVKFTSTTCLKCKKKQTNNFSERNTRTGKCVDPVTYLYFYDLN